MKKGIVKIIALSGLSKAIYKAGDKVCEDNFPIGNFDKLVQSGAIELAVAEESVDAEKEKNVAVAEESVDAEKEKNVAVAEESVDAEKEKNVKVINTGKGKAKQEKEIELE